MIILPAILSLAVGFVFGALLRYIVWHDNFNVKKLILLLVILVIGFVTVTQIIFAQTGSVVLNKEGILLSFVVGLLSPFLYHKRGKL
jgi:hypothetical protein